jgi:hypothetical protein
MEIVMLMVMEVLMKVIGRGYGVQVVPKHSMLRLAMLPKFP